jgi:inositol 3-alpha-galactosyltransferase
MTTGLPTNSTVAAKHCAWVVFLLTSPSYLPGILVLAHTLRKYRSKYPLVVAVNPWLPEECKAALIDHGLEVREVEPILPAGKTTVIAERFKDVWTKLRVYEFTDFEVRAWMALTIRCGMD